MHEVGRFFKWHVKELTPYITLTPFFQHAKDLPVEARPEETVCVYVSPGLISVAGENGTEEVSD